MSFKVDLKSFLFHINFSRGVCGNFINNLDDVTCYDYSYNVVAIQWNYICECMC